MHTAGHLKAKLLLLPGVFPRLWFQRGAQRAGGVHHRPRVAILPKAHRPRVAHRGRGYRHAKVAQPRGREKRCGGRTQGKTTRILRFQHPRRRTGRHRQLAHRGPAARRHQIQENGRAEKLFVTTRADQPRPAGGAVHADERQPGGEVLRTGIGHEQNFQDCTHRNGGPAFRQLDE